MDWAPLPSFNYSSHIRRDVGSEGLQARWGRQGWCAAVQMCSPTQENQFLGDIISFGGILAYPQDPHDRSAE